MNAWSQTTTGVGILSHNGFWSNKPISGQYKHSLLFVTIEKHSKTHVKPYLDSAAKFLAYYDSGGCEDG